MERILAAILLAAAGGVPQEGAVPDPRTLSDLFRQIEDAEAPVRKSAFEKLNAVRDPQVSARLKKSLQGIADQWIRKAAVERSRALRSAMAASRKGFNPQAFAARQKEVLAMLAAGDPKKMAAPVREMWKEFYFDTAQADSDEKAGAAASRVGEAESFLRAAGCDEKESPGARLKEACRALDEAHVIQLMPPRDQKVMTQNAALRAQVGAEEYKLVFMTNQYRVLVGKAALRLNPRLCDAAREHSRDMQEHKFFSHESPLPGKRSPQDRAARHKASASAENIAGGGSGAEGPFWMWFGSLGHHQNMLGEFMEIGVGNHGALWTEMFA